MRLSQEQFDALMAEATKANKRRDAAERRFGWATPHDGPLSLGLRTVAEAVRCGILTQDWSCVAEGLEMLNHMADRALQMEKGGCR